MDARLPLPGPAQTEANAAWRDVRVGFTVGMPPAAGTGCTGYRGTI